MLWDNPQLLISAGRACHPISLPAEIPQCCSLLPSEDTGLGSLHRTSARAGVHVFPKRIGKHEGPATPPAVALQTHRAIQLSLSPHRPSHYQEYKTDKTRHVIFYLPHSIFLNLSLLLLTLQANTKMTRLNL